LSCVENGGADSETRSFLFGYDMGVMTDVIQSPHFLAFFNTNDKDPVVGAIVSTFSGGAVFGALFGGVIMDRIGRKPTVQIGALVCLLGAILQAAAANLGMMLLGRIIAGMAVGLMSMAVPVYQSECAPPEVRGKHMLAVGRRWLNLAGLIVGITQQMIGVGFIVSTWVGFGSSHVDATNSFSWRFPLAFQALPCVIIVLSLFFFPESPRYLLEKGRDDEARETVSQLQDYCQILNHEAPSAALQRLKRRQDRRRFCRNQDHDPKGK
jgi:MFS family permease